MKFNNLPPRKTQHICLFGDPKTGKSTLAAELAKHGKKLVWISIDNGHSILYKLPPEAQANIIDIFPIRDTKDAPIAIHTCLRMVGGAPIEVCDEHSIVNCTSCKKTSKSFTRICLDEVDENTVVVWDNVSQLAESAMANIALQACKNDVSKADEFKFTFEEWRLLGNVMGKFLTDIQQASYNTVVICHTCETEMEDGSKKLVPLVGSVPFSRNVGKYFDTVLHCSVGFGGHKFGSATTYKMNILTGSRNDVAIEAMKNPSLLNFFFPVEVKETAKLSPLTEAEVTPSVKPTSSLGSLLRKPK